MPTPPFNRLYVFVLDVDIASSTKKLPTVGVFPIYAIYFKH